MLIYVGKNDWICNHVGNEVWTRALEWTGHAEFAGEPLRAWNVSGAQAGMTRSAQGLTFATIEGAGHMVRRRPLIARIARMTSKANAEYVGTIR